MTWSLTMLFVHLAVLVALWSLWPEKVRGGHVAHIFVQYLVVGLLMIAAATFAGYWLAQVLGLDVPWQLKLAAHQAEHFAVLLYVLRIYITTQERRCLQISSPQPR